MQSFLSRAGAGVVLRRTAVAATMSAVGSGLITNSVPPTFFTSMRFYGREDSQRLTFDERAERRLKKKDSDGSKEKAAVEADQIANAEFMQQLEGEFEKAEERANLEALKITNIQRALEKLDVKVAGKAVPLVQAAQLIKISGTELHLLPKQSSFTSPILQRLMKFDSTIGTQKEQNKIKLTLQPMTSARRERAAGEIQNIRRDLIEKCTQIRVSTVRVLNQTGADATLITELIKTIDDNLKSFVDEKKALLDEIADSTATSGVDESD
jgi:ribosome recycling factor